MGHRLHLECEECSGLGIICQACDEPLEMCSCVTAAPIACNVCDGLGWLIAPEVDAVDAMNEVEGKS